MKKSSIFKRTFCYSFLIMLLVILVAHGLIWLIVPRVCIVTEESSTEYMMVVGAEFDTEEIIELSLLKGLIFSFVCCSLFVFIVSYYWARITVKPIKEMVGITKKMASLEPDAACDIRTNDEFEQLSDNLNSLYKKLFYTIEQLRQQIETTAEAEKTKIDFLYAASHELKTPITACNAILENMILKVGKYNDYDRYLPESKAMLEELYLMIQNILETNRLNNGLNIIHKKKYKIKELLEDMIIPFEMIAKAKGVNLFVSLTGEDMIKTDRDLLKKALSNILMNAVVYTEKGKKVDISYRDHKLVISNEGQIIEGESLKEIFEPFSRLEKSHSKAYGGSGLGLYIVHTIFTALNMEYTFGKDEHKPQMNFVIYFSGD